VALGYIGQAKLAQLLNLVYKNIIQFWKTKVSNIVLCNIEYLDCIIYSEGLYIIFSKKTSII